MDRKAFIDKVKDAWQEYETALSALDEAQVLQPGTCGGWSVRDVVAHVMWYEREMIGMIQQHALLGSPLWDLPLEQRNAAIHKEMEAVHWVELSEQYRQVHRLLLVAVESLAQEDLEDASHFRGMAPDWLPHEVIASNTFEHYPEHSLSIRVAFRQGADEEQP